jgi:hypothetical protein
VVSEAVFRQKIENGQEGQVQKAATLQKGRAQKAATDVNANLTVRLTIFGQ